MRHRRRRGRGKGYEFLVLFTGHDLSAAEWLTADDLEHAQEKLAEYWATV